MVQDLTFYLLTDPNTASFPKYYHRVLGQPTTVILVPFEVEPETDKVSIVYTVQMGDGSQVPNFVSLE